MFEKLNALLNRWQELNEAIAQPEIIQNYGKYQSLLKERSSLQVLVETYQRYLSVSRHLEDARSLLSDPDLAAEAETAPHIKCFVRGQLPIPRHSRPAASALFLLCRFI